LSVARRTKKQHARLLLPWEREDSAYRTLLTGRHLWPILIGAVALSLVSGAHFLGGRHANLLYTRATLNEVEEASRAFARDIGRCPHNARELVHPPRSGVHYLSEPPLDAWGRAIHLSCRMAEGSQRPEIEAISAGPSGSFFSEDNIL
jgi:hypothetical protein